MLVKCSHIELVRLIVGTYPPMGLITDLQKRGLGTWYGSHDRWEWSEYKLKELRTFQLASLYTEITGQVLAIAHQKLPFLYFDEITEAQVADLATSLDMVKSIQKELKDWQRLELWSSLTDGYCDKCARPMRADQQCYCDQDE